MPTSVKARIALWAVFAVGLTLLFEAGQGFKLANIAFWSPIFFSAGIVGEVLIRIDRVWVQLALLALWLMVLSILTDLVLGGYLFGGLLATVIFSAVMLGVYGVLQELRPRPRPSHRSR
jgi:hypothetical protein